MVSKREVKNLSKMKLFAQGEALRMFEAGDTSDRLTQSWDSINWTIDQVIYTQLTSLRGRSRNQVCNNGYITRLVTVLQNNIPGANGVQFRSKIVDQNGNLDFAARKAVENGWSDFTGAVDLINMQHMIFQSMVADGEAFIRLDRDKGRIFPIMVDPALVDINFNQNEKGKPNIRFGVELDRLKRPVAYHVNDDYSKYHPMVGDTGASGNITRTRIPASDMIHVFRKQWVSQVRGIPWGSATLGDLFQINRYKQAAVTAARIGAAKMGFFYSEDDGEYTGDEESGEYSVNAEAGTFENIGNLKFEAFDPTYPTGEFKDFLTGVLQGVSTGWNIDAHTITNNLADINYSSGRIGMLETREYYKTLQTWFINIFMKPLFKRWLALELAMMRLEIGGRPLSRGFKYYLAAAFQGRRWSWVDPEKEMNGKEKEYALRITSISQIIRERGDDPQEVFEEIAEEQKLLEKLGISPQIVLNSLKKKAEKENA